MLSPFASRSSMGAPAALSAPMAPRFDGARGYNGGAVGHGTMTVRSALCELIERSHFFSLTKGRCRRTLSHAFAEECAASFETAFRQTAAPPHSDAVARHAFEMLPAVNLFDGTDTFLPLVAVSLANASDDPYLPYRDSTGCACHFDPDHALDGALMEFYERQCLVASTLLGRCRSVIAIDGLGGMNAPLKRLPTSLLEMGEIRLAEIGLHPGAYVVLATYEGRQGAPVRFSVGCAAHFDPVRAVEKALAEVLQGHVFFGYRDYMLRTGRVPPVEDVDIDAENATDTWRAFSFFREPPTIDLKEFARAPRGARADLLASLRAIGPNLLAYRGAAEVEGRIMCFYKVVSPDYPLTRRIEHPYNTNNPFFASLGLTGDGRPYHRRIPFY